MSSKLEQLKTSLAEIYDLGKVYELLDWDMQTYMPPGGAEGRSKQSATIASLAHQKFTSPEMGALLEELMAGVGELDPDSNAARLIKITHKDYQKRTRVPASLVVELTETCSAAHQVWHKARAENNFSLFQPSLEKIVRLTQEYASLFQPYDHIYDPLLDDYEPGMKTAEVKEIFTALRPQQVALIHTIAGRPQVDDAFLHLSYDEQKQLDFGVEVITRFGYDWQRGRQDKSAHPFSSSFGNGDVRITTRVMAEYPNSALFSSMHEAGHALYELGIDHGMERSPLASGASLALHESQSRLWENLVGRSLPFWEHFYPRLQAYFPSQLGQVSLPAFYRGINKVEPSFIRVEADEATYNLHIMLRLELEIALMEGSLQVKDLPAAWNARMQDYLGITPPTDALGVLQDVHWSGGSFGYFPTYALGNLVSAQLWERLQQDLPDLEQQVRGGQFEALLGWLRENIHQHGRKYEPQELVQRVTGSKIDPAPYMRYLNAKFGEIYGI
jgi:carboxypeptidase Taq